MLDKLQQLRMVSAWIAVVNAQQGVPVVYAGHRASQDGLLCRFFVMRPTALNQHYGELLVRWPAVKHDAVVYGFKDIVDALS